MAKRVKRQPRRKKDRRPSSNKRGYDSDWGKVRDLHLRANPYCIVCGELGNEVDHIVSIADDPSRRLDKTNLRTMCKKHHSRRTVYDQGWHKGKKPATPVHADGLPSDPDHPWNK